jgi:hypothetical protein
MSLLSLLLLRALGAVVLASTSRVLGPFPPWYHARPNYACAPLARAGHNLEAAICGTCTLVLFSRTHFMKLAHRLHHSVRTLFYFKPRSTLLVTRSVGCQVRAASFISPPLGSICPSPSAVSHLVSFIHAYWSSPPSPSSRAFLVIALATLTAVIMCHKSLPFIHLCSPLVFRRCSR